MLSPIHHPPAIFFDWDGTLVDTIPSLFTAHNHVRKHMGYEPWNMEEFYENLRFSSLELYPRIYGDNAPEALKILCDYVEQQHLQHLETLPGAENLLKTLRKKGCKTGIVSNKKHHLLLREVRHLDWHQYIECAVGAGEAEKDKPHADPLLLAFKHAGIQPHPIHGWCDVWYIGDTVTDMEVAANAGCKAVLILNGENKDHLIKKFNPFLVVDGCEDLQKTLNNSIQLSTTP